MCLVTRLTLIACHRLSIAVNNTSQEERVPRRPLVQAIERLYANPRPEKPLGTSQADTSLLVDPIAINIASRHSAVRRPIHTATRPDPVYRYSQIPTDTLDL